MVSGEFSSKIHGLTLNIAVFPVKIIFIPRINTENNNLSKLKRKTELIQIFFEKSSFHCNLMVSGEFSSKIHGQT